MSTDWTVEKLDALPEGTLIEWKQEGRERQAVRRMNTWRLCGLVAALYSGSVLADADPGSIRVVSVPIEAVLDAATSSLARVNIRAAIARVTGEAL